MVAYLRNTLKFIVTALWPFLFRQPVSAHIIDHVERFLLLGAALTIAKIVSTTTQIFLGRQLGAARYGDVSMVLLVASYFALPMTSGWGLAFIRMAAAADSTSARLNSLKAALAIAGVASLLTLIPLIVFRQSIAAILNLDNTMMTMTIVITVGYAWWNLSKQIAQGFQNWRIYAGIDAGWALITLAGCLVAVYRYDGDLIPVCLFFFLGYFLSGLAPYTLIRATVGIPVLAAHLRPTVSHGIFLLFNMLVGTAAFSIDRFLIFRFLGSREVGIYQAHFLATYGISSALTTVAVTYIFPLFCRDQENRMYAAVKTFGRRQFPFTMLISAVLGTIILTLYDYPIAPLLFACLCVFNAFQISFQLKSYYLAGKGTRATRQVLTAQTLFLFSNMVVLLLSVGRCGILSGGLSLLAASMVSLFYLSVSEKRFVAGVSA